LNNKKIVHFYGKIKKNITQLKQNKNIKLPNQLIIDKTVVLDNEVSIAYELNKYFVNISDIIKEKSFSETYFNNLREILDQQMPKSEFNIQFINAFEVKKIIDNLNIRKSTGIDGISTRILKHCGDTITQAIASIINNSIACGVFPESLKFARVLPIFKSGKHELPSNYRPISILPTISKIYERHIASQMQSFFEQTNIIYNAQSGFRKHHSCNTALIKLIDSWLKDIDSGKMIGSVFLDLRKAFDLVDHKILLKKLELYHFSQHSIKLFSSYLNDRKQIVKVGNIQSEMLTVKSGVPQGSILGPILFILYINDIAFTCPNINIDLYADDSTLYEAGTDTNEIQLQLQYRINHIKEWCLLNNMLLHPDKSKCMLIGSRYKIKKSKPLYLTMDKSKLENVKVQKILGIYVDETLNWHAQIDHVCKQMNSKITLLKRIIYFISDEMKSMFYNAYILPILDYCCNIWGKPNKSYIKKIYSLQKRTAKIILNKSSRTTSTELFIKLCWMPFDDRVKYHTAIQIYKTLSNMAPPYMCELLTVSCNESYKLRSATHKDLTLKQTPHTKYYKDSFAYYTVSKRYNEAKELLRMSRRFFSMENMIVV
jgi:hypothetical protein